MRRASLFIPFGLASVALVAATALAPGLRLQVFAPFLGIVYQRVSFQRALWIGLGCGLILDLLSSELHFGLHALNYTLVTALLYKQKKHFFEDEPKALALFAALISAVSTVLHFLFIAFSHGHLNLSGRSILTDLLAMPLVDGLYALMWFVAPLALFAHIQERGWKQCFAFLKRFKKDQP